MELIWDSGWSFLGLPSALLRQTCHIGTLRVKLNVLETKRSLKTFSKPVFYRTVNEQMSASRQKCFCRFVKTAVHLSTGCFLGNICSKIYNFIYSLRLWAKNCQDSGKICRQGLKNRNCILGVLRNIFKKRRSFFKIVLQVFNQLRSLSEKFSAWYY